MKNTRPFLIFLGLLLFIGLGATLNRSQPPLGRTGAPSELTCANGCHGSSTNNGPGSIALNTPAQYTPGQTYNLTLLLTDNTKSRFGFELTALNATNAAAGTFSVGSGNANVRTASIGGGTRRYVSHTNGSANRTWGINWTAPSTNVGNVTFYVAGNASNANGGTSGDNVYTQSFNLTPAAQPPVAAFTVSVAQLCDGGTVTFQNQSSGSITNYDWNFGIGASPATATGTGPHTVTYSGAGTPEAKLITAGPGGIDRDSTMIEVFGLPDAAILATTAILCEGTPTTLRADTPPAGSTYSYFWSNNSTVDSASFSLSGTYSLVVTDQNGCQDTDTLSLNFNPLPTPNIDSISNTFCTQSGQVSLTASPNGGVFSGNGILAGDIFNPDSAGLGTHVISYTVTSMVGCIGSTSDTVQVFETINISGSTLPDSLCVDADAVTLQSTPLGGVFTGPGVMNNSFNPNTAGLGAHQVQVIVTGGAGCADTTTFSTTVNPLPTASIIDGPTNTIETQAGFSNYSWAFIDTLTGNTTPLPGFNMPNFDPSPFATSSNNTGIMVVTVTDSLGCSGTSEPHVLPSVGIDPSLFSQWDVFPNPTADQLNIHFQLLQASRVEVQLFDARGTVLHHFSTENALGEKLRWNMSELPTGMYFLQIQTEKGSVVQKVVKK